MAPTVLNNVCFRYDPGGLDEAGLRALNTESCCAFRRLELPPCLIRP